MERIFFWAPKNQKHDESLASSQPRMKHLDIKNNTVTSQMVRTSVSSGPKGIASLLGLFLLLSEILQVTFSARNHVFVWWTHFWS